jgi:uncharacterized protein (TIGR02001 family)
MNLFKTIAKRVTVLFVTSEQALRKTERRRNMFKKLKVSACGMVTGLAMLLLSANAFCEDWWTEASDPKNFSATLTFTTDYVSRGISQTDNKPAVQGSFDYKHPSGAYLGIWGSNVDDSISKGDVEIDFYGGYCFELVNDLNLDASILYYYYPGDGSALRKSYVEGHLGADYTFRDLPLSPKLSTHYYYSPDFSGEDGNAHYIYGRLGVSLPYEFTLYGLVGYQWVQGDKSSGHENGENGKNGFDYIHYSMGISRPVLGFVLDLYFSDTDNESYLGRSIADERVVFSVSRTF